MTLTTSMPREPYFVLGADDPGLLLGCFIGVVLVIVVMNVVRRVTAGRRR